MDQVIKNFLILTVASSFSICQELPVRYNIRSKSGSGVGLCPNTQDLVESIRLSFMNNTVLPVIIGREAYGCGGPGWRKAAYLNMSDPTQTCPPAWELITTPKRSCARPSNASSYSCYSAIFPTQGVQYSQVCGRIIGYQIGEPQAFVLENTDQPQTIDGPYVDGVSLTYGSPRHYILTFANTLDEYLYNYDSKCPCM